MVIKKVKVKSDGKKECIQIDYVLKRGEVEDDLTGLFREQAVPEFYKAFLALIPHVVEILELHGANLNERIVPYGVTFHYSKDGTMGAIISAKLLLPEAGTSIVLNTPMRKCQADESGAGDGVFLTEAAAKDIWRVEAETQSYIAGKRAQLSLFGENGEVARAEGEDDKAAEEEEEEVAAMNGPVQSGAVIMDMEASNAG